VKLWRVTFRTTRPMMPESSARGGELFWKLPIELGRQRKEAAMHLQTYKDEIAPTTSIWSARGWSIDLVAVAAAVLLMVAFASAVVAILVR
jgi:hypothetical protein